MGFDTTASPITQNSLNEYFIAIYCRVWKCILRFAPQPDHGSQNGLDSQIELFWVYNFDFADTFPFLATTPFAQNGNILFFAIAWVQIGRFPWFYFAAVMFCGCGCRLSHIVR